ncbi:hypothetical protein EFN05_01445 [Propionibacterium freudenreichii]|uniref:Exopolyphosphatase n=1 Tax=Propionibacterium freudenreichii subsp. freudenreichii TaxID=66712 RepID=A0A0B7P195_PROFF|nr:hypothetical protein [Propionibacterium freudenreichii]AJQ91418.1 Hypothetical protein RM25_1709 [Propionibacterium freudenreichii subsp. freudenreichii]MCT2976071.1 hypothetical protein [Propionibacterium freudenreichii]MCT2992191.1 hypothetical protein [Propionibacterium freudenreichii]MCT2993608.1 hypothetical protein [Propionibacterium freudenreichii]MCT2995586.1 hypothetical protein [Propionibacterium freudenreichii]
MPTFFDSTADAAEASEALRGLAHASRAFDQPAQMYGVIGDLSSGMRSLRQVLDQIADVHERKAAHAFNDDGNHEAGVRDALAAAEELHLAASLVDRAYDRIAEGFIAAGRIAWHPDPAVEEAAPSRWVNVVFLQGDEADRPLRILGELGHVDAVDFLAQWDYGDETTQAALENGYVYDEPGDATNDQVAISGDYALVVNPHLGYVSLLRRYTEPGAEAQEAEQAGPSPMRDGPELLVSYSSPGAPKRTDAPSKREGSWFEPAKIAAVKQARGLGL